MTEFVNKDLNAARWEYFFKPPKVLDEKLQTMIVDPRDIIILYLVFNIMVTVLPAALAMYLLPLPGWVGVLYIVAVDVLFLGRFILALHYSSHRRLFKQEHDKLNHIFSYFLCPFFGIPPGFYYLHHVVMHHIENNLFPWDVSSTMPYQRDNFGHFVHYWARYLFAGFVELPFYAFKRARYDLCARSATSAVVYFGSLYKLYQFNSMATISVFLGPFLITSFALMFGNWSQHIFVDPARPRNNYALTYNCVNTFDNQVTFNDGYHIVHHVNSRLHWSLMPEEFMKNIETFGKEDALTFEGIGFFQVGLYVFTGQLEKLAKCVVTLPGQKKRTVDEWVAVFRERLPPVATPAEK
jgi:fatty acid desaturase